MWKTPCLAGFLILLGLLPVSSLGDEVAGDHGASDRLAALRAVLGTAIERNKNVSQYGNPVDLVELLAASRWRHSVEEAVRLLIASDDPQQRRAGWNIAHDSAEIISWSKTDIDGIIAEPDERVQWAAIRTIALRGDAARVQQCIEGILRDPGATAFSRRTALRHLEKVEDLSIRVKLWHLAAEDQELRAACLFALGAVGSTESVIPVVARFLDDQSTVNLAVSLHHGKPVQIRVLTCRTLHNLKGHQEAIAQELEQRISDSPNLADFEFHLVATLTLHNLLPDSELPVNRLIRYFHDFPTARPLLLEHLVSEFPDNDRFESMVVSQIPRLPPEHLVFVCQWLSHRRSPAALDQLKKLMKDPHPGVRLAATVSIGKVDPLYDLSEVREGLLESSIASPERFTLAFPDVDTAVIELALAGQSNEEAEAWLALERTPPLEAICKEAAETMYVLGSRSYINWKQANAHL